MTALRSTLLVYEEAWNKAGRKWDIEGLADCFTEDAMFFGGRPQHCVGRAAIRDYFHSYTGIIASCTLRLRDQQQLDVAPGYFVSQGFADFSFVLADGIQTKSTVRTTLILVQDHNEWRARLQNFAPSPAEPPLGMSVKVAKD